MSVDIETVLRHAGVMGTNVDDLVYEDVPEGEMAQHGVKGMKWGVRKAEETSERKKGSSESSVGKAGSAFSKSDREIQKKAKLSEKDSARLQDKYGANSLSEEPKPRLSPKQKKILIGLGIGVASAAAIVGTIFIAKHIQNGKAKGVLDAKRLLENALYEKNQASRALTDVSLPAQWSEQMQTFMSEYQEEALSRILDKDSAIADLGTSEFFIKAGETLKRVSTAQEDAIRPGGFYAAFKDEDVERYKAVLPTFWKHWGYNTNQGHIVNLVADKDIRVPSEKAVFDLFVESLSDEIEFENPFFSEQKMKRPMKNLFPGVDWDGANEDVAKDAWSSFTAGWVDSDSPINKYFFDKLKSLGFDAIVDSNDAGGLAETPLRILDGTIFKIAGHDVLSSAAIKAAQLAIQTLQHMLLLGIGGEMSTDIESVLRHAGVMDTLIDDLELDDVPEGEMAQHGIKGMKWGVRRSDAQLKRARGDISEDHVLSRKRKKKKLAELSNSELKGLNERLQLERNNNDLQSRTALAKIKRGTAAAAIILAVPTTISTAYNFSQTPAGKALWDAIKKSK